VAVSRRGGGWHWRESGDYFVVWLVLGRGEVVLLLTGCLSSTWVVVKIYLKLYTW